LRRVNDELSRAQRLAEDANIGKTRFLAAAGHDILQPLNAARLYSSSLSEKLAQSENKAIVGSIESSLDAVETILGAVLDISRLDTGALKPAISSFALDDLLNQIETDFRPLAKAKGLKLRIVRTGLYLKTDRNLMRRLVQNLVSNAIKYTPAGGVVLGVRRRRTGPHLVAADTGIGIAADKKQLVFREFTRLDEGVREAEGLGLGLSIVDRISKVLGVPVTINSRLKRGTEVSADVSSIIASPVENAVAPIREERPTGSLPKMEVLCIDNDRRILGGMKSLLEGWGCDVACAENAAQALEAAGRPDVVIADYHLGKGTGLDVIAALRDRFGSELPAILITADRSNELRDEARAQGIALLNKPVKPAALRATLQAQQVQQLAAE
jgi:CheY-like chemotaxis protein